MKDIEKAIGTLENLKSLAKYNMYKSSVYSYPETAQEEINACDLAIKALEKQLEPQPQQDNKFNYWRNICEIQAEQTAKGLSKYGYSLEQNTWLDINERLRYLQEELVDALMYIEHIKTLLNEGEK